MKTNYKNDPFFQVPRVNLKTSAGEVDFPIYYYDVSNLIAVFKADINGIDDLLKDTGLKPALMLGNMPMVFLSFYEYRHTSIGEYNEVGIAIPVLRKGHKKPFSNTFDLLRAIDKSRVGFYVVNLPVTTEDANAAGREMWGFPKFITEIPFLLDKRSFDSAVKDPEEGTIMSLSGELNFGIKAPALSAVFFSHLNDQMLRSSVNVRGNYKAHLNHDLKLQIGDSQHNMAKNLRVLDLDNKRPLMVMSCLNFQSRLNLGAEV